MTVHSKQGIVCFIVKCLFLCSIVVTARQQILTSALLDMPLTGLFEATYGKLASFDNAVLDWADRAGWGGGIGMRSGCGAREKRRGYT